MHGVEGLFEKPRSGRKSILERRDQASFVQRIVDGRVEHDPISVFRAPYIGEILKNEYGSTYSRSGVYALLHRLNFSKAIPRPRHEKNNPKIMHEWKVKTLPDFVEKVKKENPERKIEIFFQDEMRFGEMGKLAPIWQLKGSNPDITKQLGYRSCYIYGAVSPQTGKAVDLIFPETSTEVMNIHLNLVSQVVSPEAHAIIIMDRAGWHSSSKKLSIPENISILDLPAYSPQLNPVEKLWEKLKGDFLNNRFIAKTESLLEIGEQVWKKVDETMVKSTCKVNYLPAFTK